MFRWRLKMITGRPLLFSLIVFVCIFLLSSQWIRHEFQLLKMAEKNQAHIKLLILGARLEGELNAHLTVMRGLKAEIAIHSKFVSQLEFEGLVEEYMKGLSAMSHIALAPDLVISNVYPVKGNQTALGLDYRTVPDQYASIQHAIESKDTIVSGPVDLVQGGRALIARTPVFIGENKKLWGIISGVIDYQSLFRSVGLMEEYRGLNLAVRTGDGSENKKEIFFGKPEVFDGQPVIVDINLPSNRWQLAAYPGNGWQVENRQVYIFWFISLFVCVITSVAVYFIARSYRAKVQAIEVANYRANYDALSQLPNRACFSRQLPRVIKSHQRENQLFALFFIDMDYFKEVNDNWGHAVGDELLRQFSGRLKSIVRENDLVARLAGDEFVAVLKNIKSAMQAEFLAESLLKKLSDQYHIKKHDLSITVSIGITLYPGDGKTVEELLHNADRAMYQAKRSGKNCIYFFNEKLSKEVKRHVQIHNEILEGLRQDQFEIFFQPIMELNDCRVVKCEALVRWKHPEKGMISPAEFIPVAEETGAIRVLGEWILDRTCCLSKQLETLGYPLKVSINRSVAEFFPKDIDKKWLDIIQKHGVRTDSIIFEITESLLMAKNESLIDKISNLREQGIAFSIDDFGTGYSAINYLRHYAVDYLKIDRSFITDVTTDEQDRTLVEVIIKMGQALGIQVVSEGVETQEQMDLLSEYGCDYVQGYFLGKPMPFENFVEFLQTYQASKIKH